MTNGWRKGGGPTGPPAAGPVETLICFAVREEAAHFKRLSSGDDAYEIWITGMGRSNAVEGFRQALRAVQPQRVLTCGFAGGLRPDLKSGTVVFDQEIGPEFGVRLEDLGAVAASFYCARRVAITVEEKRALRVSTGADVVEMESSAIRALCREAGIPSATVRVISDAADEDLPLDFNALMTSEMRINYLRLAWAVLKVPTRIPRLLEFQRQTAEAARILGRTLEHVLAAQ